jgi:hypothetical protein
MARIRSLRRGGSICVTATGTLAASDMGRLEHACAPALTDAVADLDIDLSGVTDLDATARAVLGRMATRGARIRYPAHPEVTPLDAIDLSMVRARDGA